MSKEEEINFEIKAITKKIKEKESETEVTHAVFMVETYRVWQKNCPNYF